MRRFLPFACVFLLIQPMQFANAQDCDSAYVDFSSEGEVKIEPTLVDDAENIQCAVDEAIQLGKAKISLQKGEFLLGASISFVGFTGEFSGLSKASTIVKTIPASWGCSNGGDLDTQEQLFRVANGSVQFKTMSVVADDPCIEGSSSASWKAIDISPIYPSCDERVSFSSIDRVDLTLNATVYGRYTAIHAGKNRRCEDSLLGTLKINRSTIQGWDRGVNTEMVSGAQVDVNYSDFVANIYGVRIYNANQLSSIQRNRFFLKPPDHKSGVRPHGIGFFGEGDNAPKQNVLGIANNRFYDEVPTGHELRLSYEYTTKSAGISVSIVGNRFEDGVEGLDRDGMANISINNIDAGFIAKNTFLENAYMNILLWGRAGDADSADSWAIVDNNYAGPNGGIRLEELTKNNIVGPGQNFPMYDEGSNFVLE
ncbi:MAG: hypothetical protein CME45_02790 [Halieaceae bacterium]|nr:hypothetical protein [Halieaceae bacterium]